MEPLLKIIAYKVVHVASPRSPAKRPHEPGRARGHESQVRRYAQPPQGREHIEDVETRGVGCQFSLEAIHIPVRGQLGIHQISDIERVATVRIQATQFEE